MEIRDLSSLIIKKSEKYAEVISACSSLLKHHSCAEKAREILKNRVDGYKVDKFTFGYLPKSNELDLLFEYVSPADLEFLELIYKRVIYDAGSPEEVYINRLNNQNIILPYKNPYGDIIGIVGRTVLDEGTRKTLNVEKYKNTSLLKSMNLFGFYEAKEEIIKKDFVIIVEGQFDCITCHKFGIKNVVALGGSAFTKYHLFLIKRYTNNIKLLLDNDYAGQTEINNILSRYSGNANISVIDLNTEYKDVDLYLRNSGDLSVLK